jgi:hypothetical protein
MAPPVFEKNTLTKAIKDDDTAIDFLVLLREEMKGARALRKQNKSSSTPNTPVPSSSTPPDAPSISSSNPLPSWPKDSQPLSLSPFDRDKNIICRDPANIYYLPASESVICQWRNKIKSIPGFAFYIPGIHISKSLTQNQKYSRNQVWSAAS